MAMTQLLYREDDKGIYQLLYMSPPHSQDAPPGLYVDVRRWDNTNPSYNRRVGSYGEGANMVFSEYGEYPDYARHL